MTRPRKSAENYEKPSLEDDDPHLAAFLAFLDKSMRGHPGLVRPVTAADVAGLDELLAGVDDDVDLDAPLGGDDYCLP